MPSPDTNHFTPFGARVSPPPQIRLKGPSPLEQHIARRVFLGSLVTAVLAVSLCAGLAAVRLVEIERQLELAARV